MPSVATGANLANRDLIYFGVSGDGDTASIGMGQFVHVIRRNLKMVYLVMNNGCYGLTKGQDSATADLGSKNKSGAINPFESIDLSSLAIELGATFVAQSFSGDKEQLIPLLKAAMNHQGFALINVISPCVTFNNNVGSTKSYDYVREHVEATATVDFVPVMHEITASYQEGAAKTVRMHDGSLLNLKKLAANWDPLDRTSSLMALENARNRGEILTGLLYVKPEGEDLHQILNTSERPLNILTESELCPGADALEKLNAGLR
jgi:2-oxoglutarate ferredoxin oxidoreductase subunit beta